VYSAIRLRGTHSRESPFLSYLTLLFIHCNIFTPHSNIPYCSDFCGTKFQ